MAKICCCSQVVLCLAVHAGPAASQVAPWIQYGEQLLACLLPAIRQLSHASLTLLSACRDDSWQTVTHAKGVCALYGVCGHRADKSGLDCPDNRAGSPLDNQAMQKMQDICPQLASEFGADGNYCCTEEQIDTLTHQVGHLQARSKPHALIRLTNLSHFHIVSVRCADSTS